MQIIIKHDHPMISNMKNKNAYETINIKNR